MIQHPEKPDLLAYLHAEVSPSRKQLIQSHVAGCARCQTEINRLSSLETHLQNHLHSLAESASPGEGAWERIQLKLPDIRQSNKRLTRGVQMRKAVPAAFIAAIFLAFSLLLAVPAARAQVEEMLIRWFRAELPDHSGTVAWGGENWPFTPYTITYFPEGFKSRGSTSGILESPDNFSLTLTFDNGKDHFIKVINSQGTDHTRLPQGEHLTIAGQPAILVRSPDLEPILFGEVNDLENYTVHETYLLTWFMEDVQIEIAANFPLEEVIGIAGSIEPMEASDTTVP